MAGGKKPKLGELGGAWGSVRGVAGEGVLCSELASCLRCGERHVRARPLSCASLLFLKFIFRCSLASSSSCAALRSLFLTPSSRIAFLNSQFLLKAIFAGLCLRLGAGPV